MTYVTVPCVRSGSRKMHCATVPADARYGTIVTAFCGRSVTPAPVSRDLATVDCLSCAKVLREITQPYASISHTVRGV